MVLDKENSQLSNYCLPCVGGAGFRLGKGCRCDSEVSEDV